MSNNTENLTGLTRDTGWQIGVRRTIIVPAEKLWDFMLSKRGLGIWLGKGLEIPFEKGNEYKLTDGTTGKIKVFQPGSHWRISRNPPDPSYHRPSLIQVRILARQDKSILAFHEEHLPTGEERQRRKTHYLKVIELIKIELE